MIANQVAGLLAPTTPPPALGDFESIQTYVVGSGGQDSVTFSSIPTTWKHLQIRALMRTDRAAETQDQLRIQINSDTSANYSDHSLNGDGASATASATTGEVFMILGRPTGAGAAASTFGVVVLDILDYKDTNKYKTFRSLTGLDLNGSGRISLMSGNWRSTSAISSIKLDSIGTNWAQYSSFALYGIK